MQIIPLPLLEEQPVPRLPFEPFILSQDISKEGLNDNLFSVNLFPFLHFCSRFGIIISFFSIQLTYILSIDRTINASELYEIYRQQLDHLKLLNEDKSYNLLLTDKWMMIVPRMKENFEHDSIVTSVNSVGFSGTLLVKTEEEMKCLKEQGPMAILKSVTFPKNTS